LRIYLSYVKVPCMTITNLISTPEYLKSQYQTADNLSIRIALHQKFSTNPKGWFHWLFEQIELPKKGNLLELGCGRGDLWLENIEKIPNNIQAILSDYSEGMVYQAQTNLSCVKKGFSFNLINAECIPFPDASFDIVLAIHMLFHVKNPDVAMNEIHRVLKPGGKLCASTVGKNHLKELDKLMNLFDPEITTFGQNQIVAFNLDNGKTAIEKYFKQVRMERYPDSLCVSDSAMLIAYIESYAKELTTGKEQDLCEFINRALLESDGIIKITKDSGIIIAIK
jgi:ubiquinone/menaquinone biosynthesis C-methylase UbiE